MFSTIQSNPNVYYGLKLISDYIRDNYKKIPVDEKFVSKSKIKTTTSSKSILDWFDYVEGSYSIDDASEDEQEQPQQQQATTRTPPAAAAAARQAGPAISQDHFAAVLGMLNQQQRSRQPPQPQQPQTSSNFFDRTMFQNIMQQIMSQQQAPSAAAVQSEESESEPMTMSQPSAINAGVVSAELAAKLEQMHEFGFYDDALNRRALEVTEGNVEAAISLLIDGGDMIWIFKTIYYKTFKTSNIKLNLLIQKNSLL